LTGAATVEDVGEAGRIDRAAAEGPAVDDPAAADD
jgi:hypothetical protein